MPGKKEEVLAFIRRHFGDVVTEEELQLLDEADGFEKVRQRVLYRIKYGAAPDVSQFLA